ncbi:NAD-dependent epimerase/dehydratase family protein [Neolewinella agarilytica]|uniref:NAD-dependent epimerase/dehydratase family protein n=1 Tax=Neolewinella agarilytica TaxID=478744 RepID=UPI002354C0D6|nr:NAD-dependent epimerase/dehydratase family protein [Neolewinella agarilytica]
MKTPPDILLTGATGFLGGYLARGLKEHLGGADRRCRLLVRESSDLMGLGPLPKGWETTVGDLNDPESLLDALEGIDTIIHAAAMVSFQPEDRDKMQLVNGEGTANLVNMALAAGTRRLVHLSSVAVLNRRSGGPVVTLKDRWPEEKPNSSYAESKFAAEREVWRGQAEGLSVAVLYPSTILGAGDFSGHNTPALWRMAASGRNIYPDGSAGFVAVEDVVDATLFALDRDIDGDRFLLNAANLSWKDTQRMIAESIGAKPPAYRMPAWQSALLWPIEGLRARLTGKRPLITRETHHSVQSSFQYDGSDYVKASGRAYRDIGEVISKIGHWYRRLQSAESTAN